MESDEELMAAVAARSDAGALSALVDRHAAPLHRFLARMTGDPAEAEDLLQETWIRIARGARRFDPGRRFRPWAWGIAANLARDHHRRRRVRREGTPALAAETSGASALEQADVRGRLARLPARLREVVVLRYYEGLDEGELAQALDVPRGTVKSRLHAAMRMLRGEETA